MHTFPKNLFVEVPTILVQDISKKRQGVRWCGSAVAASSQWEVCGRGENFHATAAGRFFSPRDQKWVKSVPAKKVDGCSGSMQWGRVGHSRENSPNPHPWGNNLCVFLLQLWKCLKASRSRLSVQAIVSKPLYFQPPKKVVKLFCIKILKGWGKIWFERFELCKKSDFSQLCTGPYFGLTNT